MERGLFSTSFNKKKEESLVVCRKMYNFAPPIE
jgi:hypothetical protein